MQLLDEEGENRAARAFLMLYGTNPQTTVGMMRNHMTLSGFPLWPKWVSTGHESEHLTKAGAQSWLRHLFGLETVI